MTDVCVLELDDCRTADLVAVDNERINRLAGLKARDRMEDWIGKRDELIMSIGSMPVLEIGRACFDYQCCSPR